MSTCVSDIDCCRCSSLTRVTIASNTHPRQHNWIAQNTEDATEAI